MAESEPGGQPNAGRALECCADSAISAESANSPSRRFPAPWSVIEVAEAFVVVDADGTRLCFTYFDEVVRGANSTRWLKPEARRIADAIAMLPELIRGDAGGTVEMPIWAPWTAEDLTTWFTVTDAAGHQICALYVDHVQAGSLTQDEARCIASGIAKLPVMMGTNAAMAVLRRSPLQPTL